jgi:hypothetical protein
MIIKILENRLAEAKKTAGKGFLRNLLKDALQLLTLEYIYNSKWSNLIFKGGSCLRICHGLNRLSEDLDLDYEGEFDVPVFFEAVKTHFMKDLYFPNMEFRRAKERLYLKFPVLRQLGLATSSESDKLYVKIELSRAEKCNYKIELQPIFKEGISFVAKTYDLPTLMAGKIGALLSRTWFKGKRNEITVKGRDYYDLIWYMEKKINPRYECIGNKKISPREVWKEIKERVERLNPKDLEYDLSNLIENPGFVRSFSQNYKNLFLELLGKSGVGSLI